MNSCGIRGHGKDLPCIELEEHIVVLVFVDPENYERTRRNNMDMRSLNIYIYIYISIIEKLLTFPIPKAFPILPISRTLALVTVIQVKLYK